MLWSEPCMHFRDYSLLLYSKCILDFQYTLYSNLQRYKFLNIIIQLFTSNFISFVFSGEMDITIDLLNEMDKFIQLLESPIFACMSIWIMDLPINIFTSFWILCYPLVFNNWLNSFTVRCRSAIGSAGGECGRTRRGGAAACALRHPDADAAVGHVRGAQVASAVRAGSARAERHHSHGCIM